MKFESRRILMIPERFQFSSNEFLEQNLAVILDLVILAHQKHLLSYKETIFTETYFKAFYKIPQNVQTGNYNSRTIFL